MIILVPATSISAYRNGFLFSLPTSWHCCNGAEPGPLHLSGGSRLPLVPGSHVPVHRGDHRVLGLGGGPGSRQLDTLEELGSDFVWGRRILHWIVYEYSRDYRRALQVLGQDSTTFVQ